MKSEPGLCHFWDWIASLLRVVRLRRGELSDVQNSEFLQANMLILLMVDILTMDYFHVYPIQLLTILHFFLRLPSSRPSKVSRCCYLKI
jgi:hypothetical protein